MWRDQQSMQHAIHGTGDPKSDGRGYKAQPQRLCSLCIGDVFRKIKDEAVGATVNKRARESTNSAYHSGLWSRQVEGCRYTSWLSLAVRYWPCRKKTRTTETLLSVKGT